MHVWVNDTTDNRLTNGYPSLMLKYINDIFTEDGQLRNIKERACTLANILFVSSHEAWKILFHPYKVEAHYPSKTADTLKERSKMPQQDHYLQRVLLKLQIDYFSRTENHRLTLSKKRKSNIKHKDGAQLAEEALIKDLLVEKSAKNRSATK